MNPFGLPLRAGRAVILRISPVLIEELLTPARVSTWRDAVVSVHSVVVPSAFGENVSLVGCWPLVQEQEVLRPS